MRKFLALAALVLGLASCQNEPEGLNIVTGDEVDTVVTVTLPEATRANDSSIGVFNNGNLLAAENVTMRYILEIYYGETLTDRKVEYSDKVEDITFPVQLVPNRHYNFVVWADVVVNGETDTDNHYITTNGLRNIEVKDNWDAMDETRDAFTGFFNTEKQDQTYNGQMSINIELFRPFAKLRVVTTDMFELEKLNIIPTTVTVEYTTAHRRAFDAYTGKAATASLAKKKHNKLNIAIYNNENPYAENNGDGVQTLFTDYFFAENDVVNFLFTAYDQNDTEIKSTYFNTPINVKRNYLTTLKGDVLTEGTDINVIVKPDMGGEDIVLVTEAATAQELADAIENAEDGTETVIDITANIDLDDLLNAGILSTTRTENQYGLEIPAGKTLTLNLNGKTISQAKQCTANYSMILNKGSLTITGNGKISFNDTGAGDPNFGWGSYTLRNEGTLVVENGTIEHLGEQNLGGGQPNVHMYCAIFQYSGSTVINSGTISTPTYRSARLWNGDMTINGGNFVGQLWLQAVSDNANLVINGGEFTACGNDGSSVFVSNSSKAVKCSINGGLFNNKVGMSEPLACITGGTFTQDAKANTNTAYLAEGYMFVENGDTFVVEKGYWEVNSTLYKTLEEAVTAVETEGTIKAMWDTEIATSIKNTKTIVLDLNGKTITGADNNTSGNFYLIDNRGNLTITGDGTINLTAANDRDWNASSVVVANNPGGKLVVENGTIEHLGGTDMAYGIDNLTNGKRTYAETVINGGTIKSTYRAVRQFLNGIEAQNLLTVNGGTIEGANKSIWMQDPSKNANTGKLVVEQGAQLKGDVYLFVTADSTEWPVEVSIAASALVDNSEVLSANVPAGYAVELVGGNYVVNKYTSVATADELVAALEANENVIFTNNIKIDPASMSNAYGTTGINVKYGQTIDGAGYTLNIKGAGGTWDSGINTTGGLIKNLTVTGSFRGIFINHTSDYSEKVVLENVTVGGNGTVYTISCDQGKYQTIEATNCTFNGWTSFDKTAGEAKFVNCNFGEGSGYKYCRPYSNTEFVGCTFCPGYTVDQSNTTEITFTDCTWEE